MLRRKPTEQPAQEGFWYGRDSEFPDDGIIPRQIKQIARADRSVGLVVDSRFGFAQLDRFVWYGPVEQVIPMEVPVKISPGIPQNGCPGMSLFEWLGKFFSRNSLTRKTLSGRVIPIGENDD